MSASYGKAYIINRANSKERWDKISHQFNQIGMEYSRFLAIEGRVHSSF
jgi:hypothetical protein